MPFHATSQPGAGLTLYAADDQSLGEAAFSAKLHVRTAEGAESRREIAAPVRIVRP
jgi:hypothetical protein